MRIQSLNVAMPELVEYKGERVLTGIYKRATDAPLMARKLNIDGDGQADLRVHGGVDKAVYAFPSEHYAYYQAELDQPPWAPGQFGENLTTEGLLESSLRIGDRLRAGEALFEVSQPRSPCYKFAIKMGSAEALAVFINSARTGFYLRVLQEGLIRAGDAIELEGSDASAPTVEEIHRLYYLDRQNPEALTRALNCERLARALHSEFELRAEKLAGAPLARATPEST
jgi:MOSC domain-containing protein YiiM